MATRKPKIGKATSYDRIISEMLIHLGETGTQMLLELLNKISRKNKIPLDCRTAIIVPLHKNGIKKIVTVTNGSPC